MELYFHLGPGYISLIFIADHASRAIAQQYDSAHRPDSRYPEKNIQQFRVKNSFFPFHHQIVNAVRRVAVFSVPPLRKRLVYVAYINQFGDYVGLIFKE